MKPAFRTYAPARVRRLRQALGIINDARIAALQFDHLAEFLERFARGNQLLALLLSFGDVFDTPPRCNIQPASSRHNSRRSSGPPPRKTSTNFDDFERVADHVCPAADPCR